jgi:hypothetical protein
MIKNRFVYFVNDFFPKFRHIFTKMFIINVATLDAFGARHKSEIGIPARRISRKSVDFDSRIYQQGCQF